MRRWPRTVINYSTRNRNFVFGYRARFITYITQIITGTIILGSRLTSGIEYSGLTRKWNGTGRRFATNALFGGYFESSGCNPPGLYNINLSTKFENEDSLHPMAGHTQFGRRDGCGARTKWELKHVGARFKSATDGTYETYGTNGINARSNSPTSPIRPIRPISMLEQSIATN